MTRRIILLTGVSASGKTTLQQELMNRGWKRPINFTTRKPRTSEAYGVDVNGDYSSEELNEYVFCDKQTFTTKLSNGDFIEATQYGGNFYGITNTFVQEGSPLYEDNICIIVDPVGRSMIMENLVRNGVSFETYFIYIDKETQKKRLKNRGDSEEEINKRAKDFLWFSATPKCVKLNGEMSVDDLVSFIINKAI